MSNGKNLRVVADRVEVLMGEIGREADPAVRDKCDELVRSLMDLYGAGLGRLLELVAETPLPAVEPPAAGMPDALIERLADDDLVASLLVLHGLHPWTIERRIDRALARVRPFLGSHAGDVHLLGVQDGVVRLRLAGSCNGCPSSAVTMELSIRTAILEAAPEVTDIQVEGLAPEAAAHDAEAVASRLVQIQGVTGRSGVTLDCPVPGAAVVGGSMAQAGDQGEAPAHG
jgi:Fe-S cluster biogenesis protein NfuA